MRKLLILRPEPGASETAARARALGLEPVVSPLFEVRPLAWTAPDPDRFDAVMVTSANALRHCGPGLDRFRRLPCWAVGERSAEAARDAGFGEVHAGPGDGAALAAEMARAGVRRAFHPCGRDRADAEAPGLKVAHLPVYAAEPAGRLAADPHGAVALLHSPRAAARFAGLVPRGRARVTLAAISEAAAAAAGPGWERVAVAARPREDALLALAAALCKNGGGGAGCG